MRKEDITAADLVGLHYLYPGLPFNYMFCFEQHVIKALACGFFRDLA